ncbi:MAG: ABC transporter substrate-binding protein, partial [Acidobacteriota bacterium]|nr:ABC transporter substrate-binding protein [Acidobacteriota bacterium]
GMSADTAGKSACATLGLCLLLVPLPVWAGGQLRFCLRSEPKTFNPALVEEDASETIRYLTGGFLVRLNRQNQQLEPDLATSWKVSNAGKKIAFTLRPKLVFSDGTPFSAEDVAFTMRALMDPALHSPTGDAFRSSAGPVVATVSGTEEVTVSFPAAIAGVDKLFDQVAIVSSRSPAKEKAVLGPFYVAEHKSGSYLLLKHNPHYWRKDERGRQLPYLDSIRLDIQQNRDIEALRFRRKEIDLINSVDAELFDSLAKDHKDALHDAGPSFDSDFLWFNQVAAAPLPDYKKAWFRSTAFRRAIPEAINREDICRVVYRGHARAAAGPVSPANRFWFDQSLKPQIQDVAGALRRLQQDGFRQSGGTLRDREGHAVEFSLVTNSGNAGRARMGAMIQQDLEKIGIHLNLVTLDFPSLIERMTRTFDYEACLLGLVNVDLDPNGQMNVWLSSSSNHQWNPSQKKPETAWEAEIDRLMRAQAADPDPLKRKGYFDKVQEIAREQAPFLYLVNKNALSAVSPNLRNVSPVALGPQTYWNAEKIYFAGEDRGPKK